MTAAFILNKELVQFRLNLKDPFLFAGHHFDAYPAGNADMALTESFAMTPAPSVSGWYFSHPRSQYFVVGRVSKEQVADYARRKGVSLAQAERWLAANLDYDPE